MNRSESALQRIRVKVCGVTTAEDLAASCAVGADFIGFNFYPKSPRYVSVEVATRLRREMPEGVRAVGVFVNRPAAEVQIVAEQVGLDLVQFHGDETPADVSLLAGMAIRALRVGADFTLGEVAAWRDCWGVLFDGPAEDLYGGTGESWGYDKVAEAKLPRSFLAGGLNPVNVAAVIARLPHLYAVDVCSGVEVAPGRKDHGLLEQFFSEVNRSKLQKP